MIINFHKTEIFVYNISMYTIKKITLLMLLSVTLSIFINFSFFFIVNYNDDKVFGKFAKKIISNNYLSIEPFLNRGSFVNDFEFLCQNKECIPFKNHKISKRKKFINLINANVKGKKIVFVPMSMADTYQLLDLRYYIKNPLFVDTKSLGMSYYAKQEYFIEFIDRFALSFKIEECHGVIKNYTDNRIAYNKKIKEILEVDYSCSDTNLEKLILELKDKNVGYIIEHKNFPLKNNILFCDDREFCLYEI